MRDDQIHLLRRSWDAVKPLGSAAAELFYERLFTTEPALRELFEPTDLPAQGHRLVEALDFVVGHVDRPDELLPALGRLGERHVRYGATAAGYDAVGAALLWTLGQGLGEAWDAETEAVWRDAYALVASTMQAAANDADRGDHGVASAALSVASR